MKKYISPVMEIRNYNDVNQLIMTRSGLPSGGTGNETPFEPITEPEYERDILK